MRSATPIERALSLAMALALASCAAPVSVRRFENRAPVWTVDDRRPIARPRTRRTTENATGIRDVRAPLVYALSIPGPPPRARGVNSIGEVPDSSWFENRIGVREMTGAEVARAAGDGVVPVPPFVVVGTKQGGRALGLLVEDALGTRYLLKFDRSGSPEVETASDAITGRLLWAAGYRVPSDTVVQFTRPDLVLGDEATLTLESGHDVPLTEEALARFLDETAPAKDGESLRALASEILPGEPVGGYPGSGTRRDDPNDRIPHQHRRDVRAQQVFFGWLGHTDVKEGNTLDTWVEEPAGSGRGHLVHHIVDFGLSLGAKARYDLRPHDGFAYDFDIRWGLLTLFTLGAYPRPWDDAPPSALPGIGRYDAEHYDPARFRTTRPYVPFLFTDRFDAYWASKILTRFRREHVEAAVAEARLGDERSRRHLVDAILARREKTVRYWFGEVAPIDDFRLERGDVGEMLCADDLLLRHSLGAATSTRYRIDAFDYDEVPTGYAREILARADGTVCVDAPAAPRRHDGYLMVRYRTRRGEKEMAPVIAHFARDPETGRMRLIGIDRR